MFDASACVAYRARPCLVVFVDSASGKDPGCRDSFHAGLVIGHSSAIPTVHAARTA
jgi:hypothetical protein